MLSVFERSEAELAARLVLLAMADHAHDDGSSAFAAVPTLARKARVSERTAQRALRRLEEACEIVATGKTSRGVTRYHLAVVQGLALPSGIAGGDNLSPEVLSIRKRLSDGSGDNLTPLGRRFDAPPVTSATLDGELHPLVPDRWLENVGRHYAVDAHAFREEVARFGVSGAAAETLRANVLALYERRTP